MHQKLITLWRRLPVALASSRCWQLILGLFVVEALWFVFSAQYPMAFDENYHFGLIKLHAQQWLPFFTNQPAHASAYGEIARDPSYLYHWLLSYPYRLVSALTTSQTAQIISLRLISVALFTYGVILYRRIVRRLGVSPALSNGLFAGFILIPVVPFLAAHINYDNLFFPAIALSVLLTLRLLDGLREHRLDAQTALLLIATLALSSLIKYPFLPVMVVTLGWLLWQLWRQHLVGRAGWRLFSASFRRLSLLRRSLLVLLCVVAVGLFTERYALNVVQYHNPVPSCEAVISQDECMQYGPYSRDTHYKQRKPADFHPSVPVYIWQWLYGMWYRLFFAINYNYATARPLIVIGSLAVLLAAAALVGVIIRFRALFAGRPVRQFVLLVTVGYLLALFADGFSAYNKTAQPVAINGRYLIPFLPFLLAFGGLAWSQLLRSRMLKAALTAGVIVIFILQGGGVMTFIVRSQDSWLWPNAGVRSVNRAVRQAASPLIIGKNAWY